MDGTILVADDDRTIRTVLTQALTRAGCKVHATSSLVTLMRWVEEGKGDLVISDVVMPDGNGLETLPQISEARPGLPVIIISAQNTIMTAIKATEKEAYDYLPKPFDLPDLMKRAARALSEKRYAKPKGDDSDKTQKGDMSLPLVGQAPTMQALYQLLARVINAEMPVLISGESGTGKSRVARILHDHSDRRSLPFVMAHVLDLQTSDGLSNIVARAQGGTLLFDEVGDYDLEAQAQVVRMLDILPDPGPRVVATSQANLVAAMEEGRFRQDLYYRLTGVIALVPALRDRMEDIELLTNHFLASAVSDSSKKRIDDVGVEILKRYSWPGNVRQLENIIRRLGLTSSAEEITSSEVEAVIENQPAAEPLNLRDDDKLSASVGKHLQRYFDLHGGILPPPGLYQRILREVEIPMIEIALEATGGNQGKCADLLGINRNTLRKKLTELDIRVTRRRKLM